MEEARALFEKTDTDGNDTLSVDEFGRVLLSIGVDEQDIPALFHAADIDKNKTLDIQEFFDWLRSEPRASKLRASSCGTSTGSTDFDIEILNLAGSLLATLRVSPDMSLDVFRSLVSDSCAMQDIRLLKGSEELLGAGTLSAEGLCQGDRVTLIQVQVDRLVLWGRGPDLAWTHTLQPTQRVAQIIAGPCQAFMLLEDGTCWHVGYEKGFVYSWQEGMSGAVPAPKELTSLRDACKAPIRRLAADGRDVLFAIAGDEIWMQYRPGFDHYWHEGEGIGARSLSLVEDWGRSPCGPVRADRICDKGVMDIEGCLEWGVLTKSTGHALLYACAWAKLGKYLGEDFHNNLECQSESPGAGVLADIDLGQRQVKKIVQAPRHARDPQIVLLLEDGHLFSVGFGMKLKNNVATPIAIGAEVNDIVDVTMDAGFYSNLVALDRRGHLWRIDTDMEASCESQRMAVVGGSKISRLVGAVAVVQGADGEDAYALSHRRGTAIWETGLGTVREVQQQCVYGIGHFVGAAPTSSLEPAVKRIQDCMSAGANMLAFQCGRYEDVLSGEDGCDVRRLEALLVSGCSPSTTSPEGVSCVRSLSTGDHTVLTPLLGTFAERAGPYGGDAGETGMAEAVELLMKHGADANAQSAAIAWCVEKGALRGLDLLASAGCKVTSEDRAKCETYEEVVDEF